jgi:hypothetical protein
MNQNQTEGKPSSGQIVFTRNGWKVTLSPIKETSTPKWVACRDSHPEPKERLELPKEVSEGDILEYHLTARISNSQLGVRDLGLILEVLEYQIIHWGCNFAMYLTLVELYQRVLGQKREADEVNDPKIRLISLISEILIRTFQGNEFSLDSKEFLLVPEQVRELLSEYIMDKRTYGSRFSHWRPERWIRVRAVPVSTIFERPRISQSERYSGYTKGYGESHGSAHRQKTKPSMELDGESNWPDGEQRNLNLRMSDPKHQLANQLWIKYSNLTWET